MSDSSKLSGTATVTMRIEVVESEVYSWGGRHPGGAEVALLAKIATALGGDHHIGYSDIAIKVKTATLTPIEAEAEAEAS